MNNQASCTCANCVAACSNKPGWFMPEDIPAILAHLGARDLGEALGPGKLAVDFFDAPEDGPLVLSPNIVGSESKGIPFYPRGVCVFLKEGRCSIHAIKPFECRQALHTDSPAAVRARHTAIAAAWRGRQDLEPFRKEIQGVTLGDVFNLLLESLDRIQKDRAEALGDQGASGN